MRIISVVIIICLALVPSAVRVDAQDDAGCPGTSVTLVSGPNSEADKLSILVFSRV